MVTSSQIFHLLGQKPPAKPDQVDDLVRKGFPATVVKTVAQLFDVPNRDIEMLVGVPATTLARHVSKSAPLKARDSDRIYRITKTYALGESVLGDRNRTRLWFMQPNRSLNGKCPFELLDTESGTDRVVTVLMKIEHGIY